jgi:DNA-directed RNA polymerase beta' subunit
LHKVRSLQLGLLNPDEVRKMSVAKIENEHIYDERGLPNFNGINDPRMGTMDKELKCYVCKGSKY